ncbi:5-dehydro-4-deoxy-D-glucuronate isomerase [Paenibacillus paeoniae]|uniref:4-deoxy-L-threo-5-hexosulose-uronate ketol-isomerase n=1 Tax=Paenibacillus paeoniae TaxID=2292705 RepID=A0A371P7Z2_9BACL|nr:5-dehydro-4-deoxy-D-glucuronate isomerase [Paenibacillus paeoniae]REK71630.1 5-dehydro-4-deoxy-D-glucuronate isomerase [Paenibacillus paeoniae]
MENRYAVHPRDVRHYGTEELRENYLVESLMVEGSLRLCYSHEDRMIMGGAVPTSEALKLEAGEMLKTGYFLERREIGIINVGAPGYVLVDGYKYTLDAKDCLYIGLGHQEVTFHSNDPAQPARFYLVSTLAHRSCPTRKVAIAEAAPTHLGSIEQSNERTIYKYIHADGIESCQLMLGMTLLEPNNMWNTMPAHLHDRRSELYFYFDMPQDGLVFHFMGEPAETRHLVVRNEQAVISPAWSIHSGVGTSSYTFIWAMGGENYTFVDMDSVPMADLK